MDAPTPPAIGLHDLDRDELLELLRDRMVFFHPRDLLRARWKILSGRMLVAQAAHSAALDRYVQAAQPLDNPARLSDGALRKAIANRTAVYADYEQAERRLKRAERAADRAWKALEACWGPR